MLAVCWALGEASTYTLSLKVPPQGGRPQPRSPTGSEKVHSLPRAALDLLEVNDPPERIQADLDSVALSLTTGTPLSDRDPCQTALVAG